MRGQGESGRHAPGAREAREGKDEQERMKRAVDPSERFGILFLRLKGPTRALHSRVLQPRESRREREGSKEKMKRAVSVSSTWIFLHARD